MVKAIQMIGTFLGVAAFVLFLLGLAYCNIRDAIRRFRDDER